MKFKQLHIIPFFDGCTYLPGYSEEKHRTERYFELSTRKAFHDKKKGILSMLKSKPMGDQHGLCPVEEVTSLSSVDPGAFQQIGCDEASLKPLTEEGLDCFGNKVDIQTRGSSGASYHCGSRGGGSMTVGMDSYKPTFLTYERSMPTICVDALMTSPAEVKRNLRAIRENGPDLVLRDMEYLLWDELVKRGTGNTSISDQVNFSQDVGLTGGRFPYLPQGRLSHEFFKAIQDQVMADPNNCGKKFYVKASELQINRAINDHQEDQGIQRYSKEKIVDPYRINEMIYLYDGIHYICEEMADYAGVSQMTNGFEIVRPRDFVHQAGSEYGTVTRPNYELSKKSCTISCGGTPFDKVEIAHWYLEDAVSFVPFRATKDGAPTSGKEIIKDHVYTTPASFKTYYVAEHAVETPGGCKNDRNQFQQMKMVTKFGLFHRPDIINHGFVLLQPTERCINIRTGCSENKEECVPEINPGSFDHSGSVIGGNCGEACADVAVPYKERSPELVSTPVVGDLYPDTVAEVPGTLQIKPARYSYKECIDGSVKVCVDRLAGSLGALSGTITTVDGSAVAGVNYTDPSSVALAWADGESGTKCVDIALLDTTASGGLTEAITFDVCLDVAGVKTTQTITINPCADCDEQIGDCPNCPTSN